MTANDNLSEKPDQGPLTPVDVTSQDASSKASNLDEVVSDGPKTDDEHFLKGLQLFVVISGVTGVLLLAMLDITILGTVRHSSLTTRVCWTPN